MVQQKEMTVKQTIYTVEERETQTEVTKYV